METALNIASIVFVVTLLFGAGILFVLLWNYMARDRYAIHLAPTEPIPTSAVDSAREALESLKAVYFPASGERRTLLGHEVQRLEMRIQYLQQRANEDEYTYYQACRQREKAWHEWRDAFDQMSGLPRGNRQQMQQEVNRRLRRYRRTHILVNEEWHRAVARNGLRLEELRSQGVLDVEPASPHVEFPDEHAAESLMADADSVSDDPANPEGDDDR